MNDDETLTKPAERRTVEAWAAARSTPAWALAAARVLRHWPVGREVTGEDFDQAVDAAINGRIG